MSEQSIDQNRRKFLTIATSVVGGLGVVAASRPFLASWSPSESAKAAGAPIVVDISKLEAGALMIVEWRGKPIWIVHRAAEALSRLTGHDAELRDPNSDVTEQQPDYARNPHRSIKPEILVLLGVCTHLGCSPTYKPGVGEISASWPGGFYCPCHGSMFDLAGRVFKNVPAPVNLEVPPYSFIDDHTLIIGEHAGS